MDQINALEYFNQAKFFLGSEQYEDGIESINKAINIDRMPPVSRPGRRALARPPAGSNPGRSL